MVIHRVYADFNGLQHSIRTRGCVALYLHYFGSLKDLSRLQLRLSEGLNVTVYSDSSEDEDLEATGTVCFDKQAQQWFVEFQRQAIRHVASSPQPIEPEFPCWSCGTELQKQINASGLKHGDVCQKCGKEIHELLKPPRAVKTNE